MSDWAHEYFEHGYARRWDLAPPSPQVRLEAAGLWDLLQLDPGERVVDIGCGHGRHALALAELGAEVIGIDFAAALLNRARDLALAVYRAPQWIRGDMRRLPLRSEIADAAILMDAFGFFDTEEDNESVLREARRVLKKNGRFGIKLVNGSPILDAFRECDRDERDGTVIEISRTLKSDPPRMTEKIRIRTSRGNEAYERRQRIYSVDEMLPLFERAGFSGFEVFAGPDGTSFKSTTSPTMWIVGVTSNEGKTV